MQQAKCGILAAPKSPGLRSAPSGLQSAREECQMTVADVQGAKRAPKKAPKPSKQDLRTWIDELRAAGELQEISGAERETEIGGIVDLYMRKMGNRAVL